MNLDHLRCMGVINITPNSFSDGNLLEPNLIATKIKDFTFDGAILDFGAESTAPMNEAITLEQEIHRFETILFPIIESLQNSFIDSMVMSIDTYRYETFAYVRNFFQRLNFSKFIWNDVSGKIDSDLEKFLVKHPLDAYVFSHNLAPYRAETTKHMNYVQPNMDILKSVDEKFIEIQSQFLKHRPERLILDPCFGFSKSKEQNLKLITQFPGTSWFQQHAVLMGISRKSFLKNPNSSSENDLSDREELGTKFMRDWAQQIKQNPLYFRLHRQQQFRQIFPE